METALLVHNIVFVADAVILIALITIILRAPKTTASVTLALGLSAVVVFCVSHVIGVSLNDPELSRLVLMANVSTILITAFVNHSVFAILGKEKTHQFGIVAVYILSVFLLAMYTFFPDTFLALSVPKLYFPNYYVAGSLHWVMRLAFNLIVPLYFIFHLYRTYRKADYSLKNRLRYLWVAFFLGYSVGGLPILLIYDIPFNPVWGALFVPFFAIPFTYTVVRYELLDIKLVARRALLYTGLVLGLGWILSSLIYIQNSLVVLYPDFPQWILPFVSALVTVVVGILVWRAIRQTDILKYEFVTVVSHKFRTPLTYIKWSLANLRKKGGGESAQKDLDTIEHASETLNRLTDVLAGVGDTEELSVYYTEILSLDPLLRSIVNTVKRDAESKGVSLRVHIEHHVPSVRVNSKRIESVFEIVIANAITYTPRGGAVHISLTGGGHGESAIVTVEDNGIGITKQELQGIFQKFFRSGRAREVYTEGFGIGLYLSKVIIERHGGKIRVHSGGEGKGTVVVITLPVAVKY